MSNQFLAEIRIFAGNFAPVGWALCDGQIMAISQNSALFSLVGTFYGGNGQSTFGLPNMQGRAPMQPGQGPGLSLRDLGEVAGEQTVTLLQAEIPQHSHAALPGTSAGADSPANNFWGTSIKGHAVPMYAASSNVNGANVQMAPSTLSQTGGSLAHNNLPPYLGLTFIIALTGVFPARG